MLFTHLTRRQLFWLINCNKANFSMLSNGKFIPIQKWPIVKCNNATAILQDRQQNRTFRINRPLQKASDNGSSDYINLDHLWTAEKPATTMGKQNEWNNSLNWETNEKRGEKQRQSVVVAAAADGSQQLAKKFIQYGRQQQPKWLNIEYSMGRSGQKYVKFFKHGLGTKFISFPNILVPEDVFAFVRAMDEVLNAVEANRDNIGDTHFTSAENQNQREEFVVLHTAMATGTNYDFKLELRLGRFVYVNMRTVPNEQMPEHKPRNFFMMPIGIFHWLRRAIGEVVVGNGEQAVQQQQFGEPPSLPAWLKQCLKKFNLNFDFFSSCCFSTCSRPLENCLIGQNLLHR